MIRLSWLQFRMQAAVTFGLLAVVAVLMAVTGPHLADLYNAYAKSLANCATFDCRDTGVTLSRLDHLLQFVETALVAVPALLGAFWGGPLLARELETGTHRLVWTQSVSRTRWLAVKLTVVGLASVAATGLLSLMVTWWSSASDQVGFDRFGAGAFGQRNIVPIGYAAFAFALGVVAGMLIKRTVPAMAATLFVFLGTRLAVTFWVRPHLFPAKHLAFALDPATTGFGTSNGGASFTLHPQGPHLTGAWVYSTHVVDHAGHGIPGDYLVRACPNLAKLLAVPPGRGSGHVLKLAPPAGVQNAVGDCLTQASATYHVVSTYQPASRYWAFQWGETGLFVVAALALCGFCFWWIRRRLT